MASLRLKLILALFFSFMQLIGTDEDEFLKARQIVNAAIQKYQHHRHIPGVAVCLCYKGKLGYLFYGVEDLNTFLPVTKNTIFELGSVTKSFTAAVLAAEVLKGKVRLTDQAVKFLPGLQKIRIPFERVTLLHLATHTAGFPHNVENKYRQSYNQAMRFLLKWSPSRKSGTKYQYSNFGFGILGLALENATHQPFIELLKEDILVPLNMQETFFEVPSNKFEHYAQGYTKEGKRAEHWPLRLLFTAGGLRSTPFDMGQFLKACLKLPNTPIKVADTILFTEQHGFKLDDKRTQVLSWMKRDFGSYTIYSKNGAVTGFATFMGYIPEQGTGIVIMANKKVSNTILGQKILKELASIE